MTKRTVCRFIRSGIYSCVTLLTVVMLGTGCGEASLQPNEIGIDAGTPASTAISPEASTNTQATTTAGTNSGPVTSAGGNTAPTGGPSGPMGTGGTEGMNTVDASTTLDGSTVVTGTGRSPDPTDAATPSEQEPETPTSLNAIASVVPRLCRYTFREYRKAVRLLSRVHSRRVSSQALIDTVQRFRMAYEKSPTDR